MPLGQLHAKLYQGTAKSQGPGCLEPSDQLRPFNHISFHFPNCSPLGSASWLRVTLNACQALC